jgi:hypothetical protein
VPPSSATSGGGPTSRAGGAPSGGGGSGTLDQATLDYLLANRGDATWIVAMSGAMSAAQVELQTGAPVMAMGGWSGSDNAPTLAELKADVAAGKLRFVLLSSGSNGGGQGGSSDIASWVSANGTAVTITGASSSGWTLYDLSGAAMSAA